MTLRDARADTVSIPADALPDAASPSADGESTRRLLAVRIAQRGDLPGFSKAVGTILNAMRGEPHDDFDMVRTVLSDPSLTHKVLRLANSPMYAVFGQNIHTVTQAIQVLGIESIGHLALGHKLIDGLALAAPDALSSRNELEKTILAGHIGRQVAALTHQRDSEAAVVCAMLHGLGRVMVAFYLPEFWRAIQQRAQSPGTDERQVVRQLLGLDLDQLGQEVAQAWGLPPLLVNTLADVPAISTVQSSEPQWLAAVATMALSCAHAIPAQATETTAELERIADSYADMLGIDTTNLLAAIASARQNAALDTADHTRPARPAILSPLRRAMALVGKPTDSAQRLARGVNDLRDHDTSGRNAHSMAMALEVFHTALGCSHAVLFKRQIGEARYVARLCLGDGRPRSAPHVWFDDAYQPDVFHAALANDKIILIDNALDRSLISKLPDWWKKAMPSISRFVIVPLTAYRVPLGFLYGDWDTAAGPVDLTDSEIVSLGALRKLLAEILEQQR